MLLSTFALFLLPCLQEPSEALQRALISDDVVARFSAAREIASGDERTEKWLVNEAGKGTAQYQRTLLLSASLMGTPQTYELVERAARRGRKASPLRAFALLLYGSFHPQAGEDASRDLNRGATPFEQGCLLAGLLTRPERLTVEPWPSLIAGKKDDALLALLDAGRCLNGEEALGDSVLSRAVVFLTSADPRKASLRAADLGDSKGMEHPGLWQITARRLPARTVEELKQLALVGDHVGLVLCLYEVSPDQRQALFHHYRTRAVGADEQAWLWGAAGNLELEMPGPQSSKLELHQVAGILGLANRNLSKAREIARSYLALARVAFQSGTSFEKQWAAGTILALGGLEADRELLQKAFANANGLERQRLSPVWKFANRGFEDDFLRSYWLQQWIRDLNGGWVGYLDSEGPRWTAYLLTGGSLEAKNRGTISTRFESLEILPKDYAIDHVLYGDLAEFLLSGDYRWAR